MICTSTEVQSVTGILGKASGDDLVLLQLVWASAEQLVRDFLHYDPEQQTHVEYHPGAVGFPLIDPLVDFDVPSSGFGANSSYGLARTILALGNIPVRSITSIQESAAAWQAGPPPVFPDSSLLYYGRDYLLDMDTDGISRTGHVHRVSGAWSMEPGSIRVTYVSGWTAQELTSRQVHFKVAVLQTVQKSFTELKVNRFSAHTAVQGAIVSQSMGGISLGTPGDVVSANQGLMTALPRSAQRILEPHVRLSILGG